MRFIPVGTGNTVEHFTYLGGYSVHPRGHGEHATFGGHSVYCIGSSPWARGTHEKQHVVNAASRFIPVGTGNTRAIESVSISNPVHPRGHGEHAPTSGEALTINGSSPWARGTLFHITSALSSLRFIPVGRGNTNGQDGTVIGTAVHPRGHGEHLVIQPQQIRIHGSSPWARGTPTTPYKNKIPTRFIPVGTGNTGTLQARFSTLPVHPRGHGEHSEKQHHLLRPTGSSPWARGTREH